MHLWTTIKDLYERVGEDKKLTHQQILQVLVNVRALCLEAAAYIFRCCDNLSPT